MIVEDAVRLLDKTGLSIDVLQGEIPCIFGIDTSVVEEVEGIRSFAGGKGSFSIALWDKMWVASVPNSKNIKIMSCSPNLEDAVQAIIDHFDKAQ